VMTRLRQPDPAKYSKKIKAALERLGPLEKADLYAYGRVPSGLSSDEARELLAAVPDMYAERFEHAVVRVEGADHLLGDYEGSFGASVRDLKNVLLAAASNLPDGCCVTVPRLFEELREYLADRINHRWMALPHAGSGFHLLEDADNSITEQAYGRWLDLSDWEVREALGLVDEERYLELFRKYVVHASHYVKGERIFDKVTGQLADPDEKFMRELEKAMDPNAGKGFREDLLGRIGAWALSHPKADPLYDEIFTDYFSRMREDYYRQQKDTVRKAIDFMLGLLTEDKPAELDLGAAEKVKAQLAVEIMLGEHDEVPRQRHTRESLKETLVELSKRRY
jgi:serine protein kinase